MWIMYTFELSIFQIFLFDNKKMTEVMNFSRYFEKYWKYFYFWPQCTKYKSYFILKTILNDENRSVFAIPKGNDRHKKHISL
jgi:hypothetical protein